MMRRRAAVVLVLFGLVAAGCGQKATPRSDVVTYLKQVQRVEAALGTPLRVVTQSGNQFASDQSTHARALGKFLAFGSPEALVQAAAQTRTLRAQLAAIKTPPVATRLRALLLQLCDRQAAMTDQLAKLVAFLPGFAGAMRPFTPAVARLERVLSLQSAYGAAAVAAVYAEKAAALRQFQHSMQGIVSRLRRLPVPTVSKPGYVAQLRAVQGMGSSAGRLAGAIADGPQGNVQPLLAGFDRAAVSTQTDPVQRAEIAAVRAYDSQSATLSHLSDAIELERARLDRSLA